MPTDTLRSGAQPPPGSSVPAAPKPPRGIAVASLTTGIGAFVTGLFPVLGLLIGAAAIALGVISLIKNQPKGLSITGISLGAVGALTSLLMTIAIAVVPTGSGEPSKPVKAESSVVTVAVPDVVGVQAVDAQKQLEDLKLMVEFVDASGDKKVEKVKGLKVASVDPAVGTELQEGEAVTLTLSPAPPKKKTVAPKSPEPSKTPSPASKTPKPESPKPAPAEAKELSDIEVLDMSYDGVLFVSATFPVSDAFTKAGVIRNLKTGCVDAVQAAKDATPNWYEFDIVQCMGMMNDDLLIGSANFSGALLSEVSDVAMMEDPEAFWDLADRSNIVPAYQ